MGAPVLKSVVVGRLRSRRTLLSRSKHQFPGFLGIALLETTGHGALMAVIHMFPRKLLVPGAD
jgi:hypothetical protein